MKMMTEGDTAVVISSKWKTYNSLSFVLKM